MTTIRLAFADLAPDWNPRDNYFTRLFADDAAFALEIVEGPDAKPDFVLCGTFGHDALRYACPRILYSGEDSWPDLNLYDYAIGFPWLAYDGRVLRWPLYAMRDTWEAALHRPALRAADAAGRRFCGFVVSNDFCKARNDFFELLSAYKPVDSGGGYRNNVGGPVADKLAFQKQRKFAIAYENSASPGYLTEKLVDAFAAGAVPIYWGDPLAAEEFNPEAFLRAADYATPAALVEAVKALDEDDEAWAAMAGAPILRAGCKAEAYVTGRGCRDFLAGVFAKPGQLRRSQSCWGELYEGELRSAYAALGEKAAREKAPFYKRVFLP